MKSILVALALLTATALPGFACVQQTFHEQYQRVESQGFQQFEMTGVAKENILARHSQDFSNEDADAKTPEHVWIAVKEGVDSVAIAFITKDDCVDHGHALSVDTFHKLVTGKLQNRNDSI